MDELQLLRENIRAELKRLEAAAPAKEIAGKAIGKHGLAYITLIVVIGVGASLFLDNEKIAAVMGLLGASLTALISMLNGVAGASPKQERPEFEVMKQLIDKLDRLDRKDTPMKVDVDGTKIIVTKGDDTVTARRE